ncbi:MAG: hypothetical protein NZ901_02115 [Geminocystis sp.]|nr:hypothetical protein [Geminocystis sp.]HIK37865.1 hypothetical protein [Geminocystis sp. M7585_C2015_104]MCS7146965.1 hypothetical protein [Geminocystis sp.]MCX8077277.1 hypothetical protein [Geminocystis sp.]MDW8115789.1 hypothetical protein [Geminocystis sp.]
MFQRRVFSGVFLRNCLLAYLLVGLSSSYMADSYRQFNNNIQGENTEIYYRLISLRFSYSLRENIYR